MMKRNPQMLLILAILVAIVPDRMDELQTLTHVGDVEDRQ